MKKLSLSAKWIWTKDNITPDSRVIFRKKFNISDIPDKCNAYISVDTKYWLYVNSKQVVFEGGLFRESKNGCGYADVADISSYLRQGENVISLFCWFYGNGGRNNTNSTRAGMIFECPEIGIYSDSDFKCKKHPAYYKTSGQQPSFLYGGHNTGFDARLDIGDFTALDFDDSDFENATEYENQMWGELYERPIPLHKISGKRILDDVRYENGKYTASLPYASQVTPGFKVIAQGGEVISIHTDRYVVKGGPGDDIHTYYGHRTEYTCKPGLNEFESLFYIYGEKLVFEVSSPVTFTEFSYRESGYNCDIVGSFACDCDIINKAVKKAMRTLYVCMRDNFMDCPDRERGQWIGDVSVQLPQVGYVLDGNALLLAKKCINDFINLRKGDALVGNVPGENFCELPSQSLNAISELGMISYYYKYTADKETLKLCFEPCVNYLKLWNMGKDGLVTPRQGNWRWMDHLYNVDEDVCENAWYYSALNFMRFVAKELSDNRFDEFIGSRINSIENNFNKKYWKGDRYASLDFVDDRANALAVLCGLCPKENYPYIHNILITVFNCTVYMENYVLSALCEMGYYEDARKRMTSRYYNLAVNENTTLWEDFYILGTKNHAWSGAPITIMYRYFMGISTTDGFETVTIKPEKTIFKNMECTVNAKGGLIHIKVDNVNGKVSVINGSETKVNVIY